MADGKRQAGAHASLSVRCGWCFAGSVSCRRETVACLGSSSTGGKGQAFDWIAELRARPRNAQVKFENFGVGGDLAYNALKRLPAVLACRPGKVVGWVSRMDGWRFQTDGVHRDSRAGRIVADRIREFSDAC